MIIGDTGNSYVIIDLLGHHDDDDDCNTSSETSIKTTSRRDGILRILQSTQFHEPATQSHVHVLIPLSVTAVSFRVKQTKQNTVTKCVTH